MLPVGQPSAFSKRESARITDSLITGLTVSVCVSTVTSPPHVFPASPLQYEHSFVTHCDGKYTTWSRISHADHGFEVVAIRNQQCGALYVDDLLALEIAQQPGDGLARRTDHLRDLLMRQQHLEAHALGRRLAVIDAPVEKEAGQLLGGGLRQTEGTDLALRGVILLTELLRGVHACFEMGVEEFQEIVALDEIQLRRLDGLGRDFVWPPEDRGAGAEDFARLRDLDDQRLAFRRGGGQLRPSAAQNEDASGVFPLDE